LQGNGVASLNNYQSLPVFVDEIVPGTTAGSGSIRQSIALPTSASGSQLACTLTSSQWAHEGWGSVSADGYTFVFGE
jgi:hypothetical protein